MDLRLFLAILIGKTINVLISLKSGGGTAAPGLYALKIDPNLIKKLHKNIKNGAIVIAGTNGKTTTARILYDILSTQNKVIHNRQGSNLLRGIASTLVKQSSLFGSIQENLAIWEADEAAMPGIIEQTSPKMLVLLNLFRDQLDRYGEIETIRSKWQKAIANLPASTSLVLNADDPQIAIFEKSFKGKSIFYGVEQNDLHLPIVENVADVRFCLNCGTKLEYITIFSAHLGHWSCSKCHYSRPKTTISATDLEFDTDLSTQAVITMNHEPITINYPLPGLYNVYNVLAAVAASYKAQEGKIIQKAIENFKPAFGRFQKMKLEGKNAVIFLIKNPAGANEVLRTISPLQNINLLAILNDKIADGRDVSWIWDTNWEAIKNKFSVVTAAGIRSYDIALRLKYAGMSNINVHEDIKYSIKKSLSNLNTNNTLVILATYTAMLELQKDIEEFGGNKWQDQ